MGKILIYTSYSGIDRPPRDHQNEYIFGNKWEKSVSSVLIPSDSDVEVTHLMFVLKKTGKHYGCEYLKCALQFKTGGPLTLEDVKELKDFICTRVKSN